MKYYILLKGRKLGEGARSTHGGKKVVKKNGKWVPYSDGGKKKGGTSGKAKKEKVSGFTDYLLAVGYTGTQIANMKKDAIDRWRKEYKNYKKPGTEAAKKQKPVRKKPNTGGVLPRNHPDYDSTRPALQNVEDSFETQEEAKQFVQFLKEKGYTEKGIGNMNAEWLIAYEGEFEEHQKGEGPY